MRTVAEITIEVFESMGMTDKQAWEYMNKVAQKHGFISYANVPQVNLTVYSGKYIQGKKIVETLSKIKTANKFTYEKLAKDIYKKTDRQISDNTLRGLLTNLKRKKLIRETMFDTLNDYINKYGYKKIEKVYTAPSPKKTTSKLYVKDEKLTERLQDYAQKNSYTIRDMRNKFYSITGYSVSDHIMRNIVLKSEIYYNKKKYYDLFKKFIKEVEND